MKHFKVDDLIKFYVPAGSADIDKVFLRRKHELDVELPFTIDEATQTGEAGPLTEELKPGIWYFMIKTACGCAAARINLVCPLPGLPGSQLDTLVKQTEIVCCEEETGGGG